MFLSHGNILEVNKVNQNQKADRKTKIILKHKLNFLGLILAQYLKLK
jgi:hypothetical protein